MKTIPCAVFSCEQPATHGAIFRHNWRSASGFPVYYYCPEHRDRTDKALDCWHIAPGGAA